MCKAASAQTAGNGSAQKAGSCSAQTAGSYSAQQSGNYSMQTAGNYSMQKAGTGSVQITRWFADGAWHVATRVIDETSADVWYYVEFGVWRKCTRDEIKKVDAKATTRQEESDG